jgi:pyruvate,water dikinase
MYEAVYRQFASLLGVEDRLIEEEADTFARMLGLLQGRVYYNLLSWYKALSLVPGYSLNAAFMENMMGVKERFDLPVRRRFSRLQEYKRLLRTGWGIISNLRKLESNRLAFLQHVHTVLSAYKQKPWSTMDATQLWEAYLEFEHTLVKKWKAPLVNDFFAMIYFGVLQKLVLKYQLDTPGGNLHNDLVAGSGDIVSTEPIRLGLQLSGVILDDVQLRNLFQNHTPEHIYQQLKSPEYQGFYHSLQSFLDSWGDRCVGELKLETVTYNLEPERYIAILQEYVKNGLRETQMQHSGAQTLRAAAERKVQQSLKSFWKRLVWNHVLKKARYLISHRENLRYERTRGFGMVRKIFLHLGIRWQAEGVLHSHRDIFWLSISEIRDFVQGTSVHPDLKSLVELRKKMYATLEAQTLDERLRTYGPPYYANRWRQASREPLNEGDLKGIPCCAGLVKARVRVLHQPQHVTNLKGCILVTSSTDPGWAPLFPSCAGILVERGSLLSHSAIVSRELGIPCIVGIPHLLERLEDGQWVEMDGSTGLVRCIDEP